MEECSETMKLAVVPPIMSKSTRLGIYTYIYIYTFERIHMYVQTQNHAYIRTRAREPIHSQRQIYQRYMRAGAKV